MYFVWLPQYTVTSSHTALSVYLLNGQCVLCEVQFRLTLGQKRTEFRATEEPPPKSRRQKGDMQQLTHSTLQNLICTATWRPELVHPCPSVAICFALHQTNCLKPPFFGRSRPLSFWRVSRRTVTSLPPLSTPSQYPHVATGCHKTVSRDVQTGLRKRSSVHPIAVLDISMVLISP
jgi:hypothetical protein